MEAKSVFKKPKTAAELEYKFSRFALRDSHFKALESKGRSKKAWLHGETIVAYLESQKASAFIFEDHHTTMMFHNKEVKLSKNVIFYLYF